MCQCRSVGDFFVIPNSFTDIFSHSYKMKNRFSYYILVDTPCDEAYPAFNYGQNYYSCLNCHQSWYFECYPDTPTSPIFGVKILNIKQILSENYINSIKRFLVILTHEGFSENKCIHSGCMDYSLKGIKVCINHFGYKYTLD